VLSDAYVTSAIFRLLPRFGGRSAKRLRMSGICQARKSRIFSKVDCKSDATCPAA
jgi:hypothetical protein